MIITTRTGETRFNVQTNQQVSVDTRIYVCDYRDDDDGLCSTVQEEGHAPEDLGRIPRGWRIVAVAGWTQGEQMPLYCPKHTVDEIAGRSLTQRHEVDITLARELADASAPNVSELIRGRR